MLKTLGVFNNHSLQGLDHLHFHIGSVAHYGRGSFPNKFSQIDERNQHWQKTTTLLCTSVAVANGSPESSWFKMALREFSDQFLACIWRTLNMDNCEPQTKLSVHEMIADHAPGFMILLWTFYYRWTSESSWFKMALREFSDQFLAYIWRNICTFHIIYEFIYLFIRFF